MSDIAPEFKPPQTDTEKASTEKNVDKSVKSRFKKIAGRVMLGTPLAGLILSSGTIDNPNVHPPNIKEPIPAAAPLPKNTSHNTDILQPYTPQASAEIPTLAPTPHVSAPSIPEVPNIEQQTAVPSQPSEQKTVENKELVPYSPSITIIDAAPSTPTKGLIQKEFISNEDMIRKMLGDIYVSKEKLVQEFGRNYQDKWDEVVEKYPQALVYRFSDIYFNHGKNVAQVAKDTLERSGFRGTGFNILPLQKIFDKDSVKFIKDSSGNPGIRLNFEPQRIIKLLEGDKRRVVNGSFEVGNVELFQKTDKQLRLIREYDEQGNLRIFPSEYSYGKTVYYPGAVTDGTEDGIITGKYYDAEGKEIEPISVEDFESGRVKNSDIKVVKHTELSIVGAYAKEKAMENLPKLFEVCNAYPDKFFVFAGGNSGEDFREAMEILKDQVPKNFLVTAEYIEYDYGYGIYKGPSMSYGNYGPTYGPDIYVFNERSKHPHGSSFSVPELSTEIDILLSKGFSMEQAREKILASSDVYTASLIDKYADRLENGAEITFKVFNPSKIQEK